MPGANDVLGCPQIKIFCCHLRKYFYIRVKKFWRPFYLFLVIDQNFEDLLWDAPIYFFLFFFYIFKHLPTLLLENWVIGCPPGWMPRAIAPPLNATVQNERYSLLEYFQTWEVSVVSDKVTSYVEGMPAKNIYNIKIKRLKSYSVKIVFLSGYRNSSISFVSWFLRVNYLTGFEYATMFNKENI